MRTMLAVTMLFLSGMALAAETPLKTGDWLEWRFTVPSDPLEARLAEEAREKEDSAFTDQTRSILSSVAKLPGDAVSAAPMTELPKQWKTISLRMEVREATVAELKMRVRTVNVVIDTTTTGVTDLFLSEDDVVKDAKEDRDVTIGSAVLTLNGVPLTVRTERWSTAPGVEWERWTSETVPGGLVRMAGPSADLVLVGWGRGGEVPAVPLKDVPTPPALNLK